MTKTTEPPTMGRPSITLCILVLFSSNLIISFLLEFYSELNWENVMSTPSLSCLLKDSMVQRRGPCNTLYNSVKIIVMAIIVVLFIFLVSQETGHMEEKISYFLQFRVYVLTSIRTLRNLDIPEGLPMGTTKRSTMTMRTKIRIPTKENRNYLNFGRLDR